MVTDIGSMFSRGGDKAEERSKGVFEAVLLPDDIKRDLCFGLLEEFGAHSISENHHELVHGCMVSPEKHNDQERNPTASLNWDTLTFNCLSADTIVKTYDGERRIGDLAGQTVEILDGDGNWTKAPIKHYGRDRLYRVTLTRNGVRREVYTTANHRWYVRSQGVYKAGRTTGLTETTTADLQPKQRIPSVWPDRRTGRLTVSPTGVMAGFVYGDGSVTEWGSVANFVGSKDAALESYFGGHEILDYGTVRKVGVGLPRSWKTSTPALDEGYSYLYGWLAGYFAADGCVADDGHATLSCANKQTLDFVVTLCDRLGVATYTLNSRSRVGFEGREPSDIHTLSFRNSTLTPEFFLVPAHRDRYERAQQTRRYERTHWWVSSVEETDRFEDVYCAEVETTQSFVLAGNILTGNCLGCQKSGGILWFISEMRLTSTAEAMDWLNEQTGLGGREVDITALMRYLDALYSPQRRDRVPIPQYGRQVLDAWAKIHPYLTDPISEGGRGIQVQTAIDLGFGYAEEYPTGHGNTSERIVLPHFWKGKLVGWQTRRMCDDGSPKYLSSPDFPKDQTIYNYQPREERAVVMEAMLSVASKTHLAHSEATFGAKVTDTQLTLLAKHPVLILFMDNDRAGWDATERIGTELGRSSIVMVVDNPYAADPADITDEDFSALLRKLTPFAVWRRPDTLYCYRCKAEAHQGPCHNERTTA